MRKKTCFFFLKTQMFFSNCITIQNCRSRVFKIVGVGFSKLSESGFQNCRSRVFKIVGVGFSKLSESGFQNCRSRVFKIVGVGFSKMLESGVGFKKVGSRS